MESKSEREPAKRRPDGDPRDASAPRRRRNGNDPSLRYILTKPELGHKVASEGEALIEAFKNCQQLYRHGLKGGGSGNEWPKSCDCETGCRYENDLELLRTRSERAVLG